MTMTGALPPSSSETLVTLSAAAFMIFLPTSVEPVMVTMEILGLEASALPVSAPDPVMTLMTPLGRDDFSTILANSYAPLGQSDDALSTTVQPAMSAGATLRPMRNSGKFHGMIWPATPMGIL